MMRIAINGFGRIGKTFLRVLMQDKKAKENVQVAVINTGKGDPEAAAFALKYDTLMGTYNGPVEYKNNKLYIDNQVIDIIAELDPEKCPWKDYNIDWVVECSGKFTKRSGAEKHLKAGAKAVLITAPAEGEDITIIPGVNLNLFNKQEHKIVSLGSCTTNSFAVMLKVLDDVFKVDKVFMTTIHAYTNSQALLDVDPNIKDLRKKRAAAVNIIPTTTGAMELAGRIFPHLANRISAISIRVPVPKVSIIDLVAILKRDTTAQEINQAFKTKSETDMKNFIKFTTVPLVSSDYFGDSHSAIIDGLMTEAHGNFVKVFGWYDNEWGYSERLKDFLLKAR